MGNRPPMRPTWAEIDLGNLRHNYRVMQAALGAEVQMMAALKADAYGHGAIACARTLATAGAEWFGVALPEEGLRLRDAGIEQAILSLGGFWEGQEAFLLAHNITPVIYRIDLLERLNEAARAAGRVASYHLKVDTGLGRLGVPFARLEEFLRRAMALNHVKLDGLMSHFAAADAPDQLAYTEEQMVRFTAALERVHAHGFQPQWIHQANSAAAHAYAEARGNLVRLGGLLYGLWGDSTNPTIAPLDWRPVLSLHSRISLLKTVTAGTPLGYGCTFVAERDSRIATLPIGYEDGLRRGLSNCGRVMVRGRFAPIVGRVSMDLTIVDVTEIAGVAIGDEAILIGRQGKNAITAEAMAVDLETISYEVTCGISERVPRVYRNE